MDQIKSTVDNVRLANLENTEREEYEKEMCNIFDDSPRSELYKIGSFICLTLE